MTIHKEIGIWKSGSGKGKKSPKGRQAENTALVEISNLLGTLPLRKDLLIEYLHLVQDKFGYIDFLVTFVSINLLFSGFTIFILVLNFKIECIVLTPLFVIFVFNTPLL